MRVKCKRVARMTDALLAWQKEDKDSDRQCLEEIRVDNQKP